MRVLLVADFVPGEGSIEAKACAAHDDSLRCWRFSPISIWPAAAKCAGNSVTIGMARGAWDGAGAGVSPASRQRGAAGERVSGVSASRRGRRAYTKKVRSVCWKAAMGQSASGKAAWRWARTWAAGRCEVRRQPGRQFGRRAASQQGRADLALAQVEAFPDALPGPVAEMAVGGADGGEDAAGDGALEEPPQSAGGQAEPSDFVGEPDAEGPPATGPCIAVAAKDPPGADAFSPGVALVKAVQKAVANQRADDLAVRTGRLLEPFGNRVPFLVAAVKPSLLTHGTMPPRKS